MAKLTKSWSLTIFFTILAAVLPIINEPLEEKFGIVITEQELTHFLALFGITAGAGVLNSARKAIKPRLHGTYNVTTGTQTDNQHTVSVQVPSPKRQKHSATVEYGSENGWYQTNFVKDMQKGNVLHYGQAYLWIRIAKARSYITAILRDSTGNVLQVGQSSDTDEDNNVTTTRLEMFGADGKPLPRGHYSLSVQSDSGTGDSQGIRRDLFEVV